MNQTTGKTIQIPEYTVSVAVNIPSSLAITPHGLAYHVRKALDLYAKARGEAIVPELGAALSDPCNVDARDSSARLKAEALAQVRDVLDGKPEYTASNPNALIHELCHRVLYLEQVVKGNVKTTTDLQQQIQNLRDDEIETLDDTAGKHAAAIRVMGEHIREANAKLRNTNTVVFRLCETLAPTNSVAQEIVNALKGE